VTQDILLVTAVGRQCTSLQLRMNPNLSALQNAEAAARSGNLQELKDVMRNLSGTNFSKDQQGRIVAAAVASGIPEVPEQAVIELAKLAWVVETARARQRRAQRQVQRQTTNPMPEPTTNPMPEPM
jgi:hypothetical protein